MSPGRRPSHGTRPASIRTPPTRATTSPITSSILPRSFITPSSLKECALPRRRARPGRRGLPQVSVRLARHAPAARLPGDEADLEQVRLDDLRQRLRLVVDGGGHRLDADRPAPVHVDDRLEEAAVELVEPAGVHALAR